MSSWRSSNVDETMLAAFTEKGPLLPKEEVHWRVLSVVGFVVVHEAFIRMEPYEGFFRRSFSGRALLVGKPPKTTSIGGCAPTDAQIGQFLKLDEMSETSISHGGLSLARSTPRPGAIVRVAADHDGIVPGRPGEGTTVADVVLDVADDGALEGPMER